MADLRNSRDHDPLFRQNEPNLSHSFGDETPGEKLVTGDAKPSGLKGLVKKLRKFGDYEQNPHLVLWIAAFVTIIVLGVLLAWQLGFFGGKSPPVQVAAQPPTMPLSQEPAPPSPFQSQPKPEAKPSEPTAKVEEPQERKDEKEDDLALPKNVGEWKKNHYLRARKENHPKLIEAVQYLGKQFRGSESVGQGLTELLRPLPPEPEPSDTAKGATPAVAPMPVPGQMPPTAPGGEASVRKPPTTAELTALVQAIIAALGKNGSTAAHNTLKKIIAGEFQTDDDKAAVESALSALVENPSAANNALLLELFLTPENIRPSDREGAWPAKQLSAKAFDLVRAGGTISLRQTMAGALTAHLARLPPGDPLRDFLLASDPRNVGAQLILYEKASTTRELKTTFEQQFSGYGSAALASLLGIAEVSQSGVSGYRPPGRQFNPSMGGYPPPSDQGAKKEEVDISPEVLALLWADPFRERLNRQLDGADSLEHEASLALLGAMIPMDDTRVALARLLRKNWLDGPKCLESIGLPDRLVTDPGFLVAVKMLPRKEAKTKNGAPGRPNRPTRTAPNTGRLAEAAKSAQKKEQSEQEWLGFSSKLVGAWRQRFDALTALKLKNLDLSKPINEGAHRLPADFSLNEIATVVASHHVVWPEEVPANFKGPRPSFLEVHYLRANEINTLKRASGFYARQLQIRITDLRELDKATWLDGMKADPQKGRRQSIDVLITRSDGAARTDANENEETDLIVEVFAVEIKDPVTRD